ncbi:MAG: hypothetical protein HYZ11_08245 [Candidatus Tectomicrobia bacterium]|uniref:Uncharacterized protein n=1 Tax=Tectimicrobiota bacterium TaxID=2528274 RepID=A0A932I0K9_UNCTE|nr:hypothetical protein [Candidatus Tectomicrobia bacterium]
MSTELERRNAVLGMDVFGGHLEEKNAPAETDRELEHKKLGARLLRESGLPQSVLSSLFLQQVSEASDEAAIRALIEDRRLATLPADSARKRAAISLPVFGGPLREDEREFAIREGLIR